MKAVTAAVILSVLTLGLNAQAMDSDVLGFIKKVKALDGRKGRVLSSYENESTGVCRISVEDNDYGVTVSFQDTGFYFTPIAHIDENSELDGKNTLLVETNSDRVGGDACGSAGGAIGYKRKLTVTSKQVKIEETFRCTFEAFKKHTLTSICNL